MTTIKDENARSTPSDLYSEEYYLESCEGHESFELAAQGKIESKRLAAALDLTSFEPGLRILDVGCGRGEVVIKGACSGANTHGIDYSVAALRLAQRTTNSLGGKAHTRAFLARADCKWLPYADESFDRVLMFDVVEHLYPWELEKTLHEAQRVLRANGQLIVHTAPNQWYYRFGYPIYRIFERLRGNRLPRNPRDRFPFHHLHVNEQSILSLRKALHQAGFEARVWLDNVRPPLDVKGSPLLQGLLWVLLQIYPFRLVFRNDVFAIALKPKRA